MSGKLVVVWRMETGATHHQAELRLPDNGREVIGLDVYMKFEHAHHKQDLFQRYIRNNTSWCTLSSEAILGFSAQNSFVVKSRKYEDELFIEINFIPIIIVLKVKCLIKVRKQLSIKVNNRCEKNFMLEEYWKICIQYFSHRWKRLGLILLVGITSKKNIFT